MMTLRSVLLSTSVLLIGVILPSIFFTQDLVCESSITDGSRKLLVVGVVSSPDHQVQRSKIRQTWGSLINWSTTDLKFLIGKPCSIPVEDRESPFSCEPWRFHISPNVSVYDTVSLKNSLGTAYSGFHFIVKHNITVTSLGVASQLLAQEKRPQRIVLGEAGSKRRLASVTIGEASEEAFTWKRIPDLDLASGFEGSLFVVDHPLQKLPPVCRYGLNFTSGLIQYLATFRGDDHVAFLENSCSVVGSTLRVRDQRSLEELQRTKVLREEAWAQEISMMNERLRIEQKVHSDLLLFSNVIDSYRNIPSKVLHFFNWALIENKWEFILKTDDDVFIDINSIEKELQLSRTSDWDIWSCFRVNWTVPRSGKWRDYTCHEETYPPFPTGSGYVLPIRNLQRISVTYPQAGEDVNVGATLGKAKFHGGSHCTWSCNKNCTERACNLVELTPERFDGVWSSFQNGTSLCSSQR